MKLLTHNMLSSRSVKGVNVGFPLGLTAVEVKETEVDFNPEFVLRMIPKLDWPAFYGAATSLGKQSELPQEAPSLTQGAEMSAECDQDLLKKIHHVLLECEVISGELVCPESGRKFPINNGIPRMLLNEDENKSVLPNVGPHIEDVGVKIRP